MKTKPKWGVRAYLGPAGRERARLAEARGVAKSTRKPIKRQTPETARRTRIYNRRVKTWLAEHKPVCEVYRRRMDKGLFVVTLPMATQCHHKYGRKLTKQGDLLLEERFWLPVSASGHEWINANPSQARELGLLAELGKYNTWPE